MNPSLADISKTGKDGDESSKEKEEKARIDVPIRLVSPFERREDRVSPQLSKYIISEFYLSKKEAESKKNDQNKVNFMFSEDAKNIPIPNLAPLPKNNKQREAAMVPFRSFGLSKEIPFIHEPEQPKTKLILIFGLICTFFIILFLLRLVTFVSIYGSIFFFILTVVGYLAQKRRRSIAINPFPTYAQESVNQEHLKVESPSAMFARPPSQDDKKKKPQNASLHVYRSYMTADRPSASIEKSRFGREIDYDQLFTESLKKLGISSVAFNKYVTHMKTFIARTILAKFVKKIHSDEPRYALMRTVPGFEHCSAYVLSRINSLASSSFLATHLGDKGDRWHDREWTTDLPSDNQIVMHIFSAWISFFLSGKRKGKDQLLFSQKYLFVKRDPVFENENDVLLCSDDWAKFYVYTSYKSSTQEKFYVALGRDSMYAALTLFFWFIKEKKKFLMEAADLKDSPICMDRVFSLSSFE